MELSDQQRQQVRALSVLLTSPDQDAITQGIELAAALDDPVVFGELLAGVAIGSVPDQPVTRRRYPSLKRGTLFEGVKNVQPWLDLAMVHLLAASEIPLREQVPSVALGAPKIRGGVPNPRVWLHGLERLTALTHLDLLLSGVDGDVDLGALASFPSLTHLRVRGRTGPLQLPKLEHLELLDGGEVELGPDVSFPALRSLRGRVHSTEPLSPEMLPNLVDVEVHGSVRIRGFESLGKLYCTRGDVEVLDCVRVGELRVSGPSFNAPDLRHVGTLDRIGRIDVSQFETIEEVRMNRTTKFLGKEFPPGTKLADSRVILWGPTLTSLGNIGELPGLEVLSMLRTKHPVSLDTLRHAASLRVLDIRNSPGITDLSPLIGLPKLEMVVLANRDTVSIPSELESVVKRGRVRLDLGGKKSETQPPGKKK